MRTNRLLTVAAVLLSGIFVSSIAKGETTWAQSYGVGAYATFPGGDGLPVTSDVYGSGTDTPAGLAPMPDGGFVVVGQLDLPEFGSFHTGDHAATAMVRYGVDGTILWQQLLRDTLETGIVYVDQIRADGQGNVFVAGSKHDGGNGTATPFVAKFSPAGALVWENGIAGSHYLIPNPKGGPPTDVFLANSYTFLTMNLTSDGGVVAGGTESTTNGADPHAVPSLARFGPNGSLVFNQLFDYTVSGFSYEPTFAVCQSVDGMHYLVLLAAGDNGMTAILTDAAGSKIGERTFFIPTGRDFPAAALATADGGFITYSQISNPGGASVGAVVRKLHADLTPVWEKVLVNNYGSQPATFAAGPAIVQTADGGFLISGHMSGMFSGYDLGSENSDAVLVKLDADGALQAAHLLGGLDQEGMLTAVGGGPESFCMAIQTTDGGYALALPTISYKTGAVFPDWWVAKTDANGRVSGFPDVTGELPSFVITSTDNTHVSQTGGIFGGYPPHYSSSDEGSGPNLVLDNLSARTGINRPNVQIQAASFTGPDLLSTSGLLLQSDTYQVHRAWRFQAIQTATTAGLSLHVQFSTAPLLESSWTELPGGGQMTLIAPAIGLWELDTTQPVPDSTGARTIFFRVISAATGAASTVTNFSEPYTINPSVPDLPPTVQITAPAGSAASNPSTSEGSSLTISVTASDPDDGVASVAFYDNGSLLSQQAFTSGNSFNYVINQIGPGKHLLEAKAKDVAGLETASTPVTIFVSLTNGTIYTFTGSGDWNSATNWTPSGIPGSTDTAVIGAGSVSLSQDVTVRTISLDGGNMAGPGALTVTNRFVISTGQLTLDLTIDPGATCALIGDTDVAMSGTVVNNGSWIISGYGGIAGVPTGDGTGRGSAGPQSNVPNLLHAFATLINRAVFAATHPRGGQVPTSRNIQCHSYTNTGRTFLSAANIIGHDGAGRPAHSRIVGPDGDPGHRVKNEDPAGPTPAAYTQNSGETDLGSAIPLEQGRIVGSVTINGGVLTGSGIINGDLTNNGGVVSPGHSAGHIQVTGDFLQASAVGQAAGGTLVLELGGADPSQFDQVQVLGAATLGGTLNVQTINGFAPQAADVFAPITYASHAGSFGSVSSNVQIILGATGASVSVDPAASQPSNGQPRNISTRMKVLSGENVLITGFIVTGPSGSTKKVLIRGLGPSLAQFGVPGTLPDPFLELHEPDGTVVVNDNWADAPNIGEIPPGFSPGDPKESVVIATLTPGSYTAIVKGAHGETGVGLAEVYDLDSSSSAKLANVSTRGFIDAGDNVMIGGFIVGGTEPARILVRAIGPSLTDAGVQGALADPVLELHDANGSSFNNDNWRESQESEIIASTIPPSNDREPAILATLVPGSYTAIVRGKNDTTGIGLVEAYNLQ